MPIDNKEFDYIPLDLPNVQCEVEKGRKELYDSRSTALRSLTSTIAMRKPQWRFIVSGRKVRAYENNELLGSIHENQQRAGSPFAIAGHRVDKKVKRGQNIHTKDAKKAAKLIFQNFIPLNLSEKASRARQDVLGGITRLHGGHYGEYNDCRRLVTGPLLDSYLSTHWAEVEEALLATPSGFHEEKIKKYPSAREQMEQTLLIQTAANKGNGVFIVLVDDVYVISTNLSDPVNPNMVTRNLPESLREGLGLLKLAGDNQAVSGVGYRYDATKFFIMGVSA